MPALASVLVALSFFGPAQDSDTDRQLSKAFDALRGGTNPKARIQALHDLATLGAAAKPAAKEICRAMTDRTKAVRTAAAEALEKVDPAIYPHVVTLTADADPVNHAKALLALAAMKKDGAPALPVLMHHLNVQFDGYRNVGKASQQLDVDGLRRELRAVDQFFDPKVSASQYALTKAMNRSLDAGDDVAQDALAQRRQHLRELIGLNLCTLAFVAGDDPKVAQTVGNVCKTDLAARDERFKLAALDVLGYIAHDHPQMGRHIVGTATACARSQNEAVRLSAVTLLGQLGEAGRPAAKLLIQLKTADPSAAVRQAAGEALAKTGS